MWEPRRLITTLASTARCRDSFTFTYLPDRKRTATIVKSCWLMQVKERTAVYLETSMKHVNTCTRGRPLSFLVLKLVVHIITIVLYIVKTLHRTTLQWLELLFLIVRRWKLVTDL
jgi:hypothetical protein